MKKNLPTSIFAPSRTALLALLAIAVLANACGEAEDQNSEHQEAGWIEIETRGAARALLARWDEISGWSDAEGNPITELPTPVDSEADGLIPFSAGGDRASLSISFFDRQGDLVEMSTLSRDETTGERQCSEYSARYNVIDAESDVLAWPNLPHPDNPTGPYQFVELPSGDVAGIFHCDHVHIYPLESGSVEIEFLLWHFDHADDVSDPITIRVE